MKTFEVRDTNEAMYPVYSWLSEAGVFMPSRNGMVLQAPEPVTITYTHPLDRVNLCPLRDANPAFHLLEGIWMLSGSNLVRPLAKVVPRMNEYTDNMITLNAAYGHRARRAFGVDQLDKAGGALLRDQYTRQAVVQLWDPKDLGRDTNDKACNMALTFARSAQDGRLDMHVHNRSNDAVWGGVSGANVAHMPFFLEYVAKVARMIPGKIIVTSLNLHAYLDNPKTKPLLERYSEYVPNEYYKSGHVCSESLFNWNDEMAMPHDLMAQCQALVTAFDDDQLSIVEVRNEFLLRTVRPLLRAWQIYKGGDIEGAISACNHIRATDWHMAMVNWLGRREKNG